MSRLKVVLVDEGTGWSEDVVALDGFPSIDGDDLEACTEDAWYEVRAVLDAALHDARQDLGVEHRG